MKPAAVRLTLTLCFLMFSLLLLVVTRRYLRDVYLVFIRLVNGR